ncbi:MAG: M48 family metallopeptidase [Caedimonas sp.]|nr:M48 family metallopeptidase [Caedimonas sp.]
MTFDLHSVPYGSQTINFELRRAPRKTMAIHVHPDMRVEVVAPQKADLNKVYQKVRKRAKWVRTQQIFFEQFHPKTPPRQYISGENHRYLGRQLRLKIKRDVICGVKVSAGHILVSSHYPNNTKLTRELVTDWLKARAHQKFKERFAICVQKFPKPEKFTPHSIIIRQLNNRWGSMTGAKRLVLNTRLIHASVACIDYVIIHELCHMQYPNHSPKFWKLLTAMLPDWHKRKNQLEKYLL